VKRKGPGCGRIGAVVAWPLGFFAQNVTVLEKVHRERGEKTALSGKRHHGNHEILKGTKY